MSSFSEDDIRRAAEVREWLVKEVTNKKEELDKLRNTLQIVDSLLKRTSFITASNLESSASHLKNNGTRQPQSVNEEDEDEEETTQQELKSNSVTKSPGDKYRKNNTPGAEIRSLKRVKDNLLISNAEYTPAFVKIALTDDLNFNINTPPFKTFFLNRILEGMKTKDKEKVQKGELGESEVIDYKV